MPYPTTRCSFRQVIAYSFKSAITRREKQRRTWIRPPGYSTFLIFCYNLHTRDHSPQRALRPQHPSTEWIPLKVGVFSALFSHTFRGRRPRTALCGFPVPKVGVFSAISSPTFRGHRPHTALCGFPVPKVGVFFALFSPTFRGHRPRTALCGFSVPKVGVFSALFSPTSGEAAGAELAAGELSGRRWEEAGTRVVGKGWEQIKKRGRGSGG